VPAGGVSDVKNVYGSVADLEEKPVCPVTLAIEELADPPPESPALGG